MVSLGSYHGVPVGGLNNRNLFLAVEEAGKCEVRLPPYLGSVFRKQDEGERAFLLQGL